MSSESAAVRRLAAAMGENVRSHTPLARRFYREGARTLADLRRPERLALMTPYVRANVLYKPVKNIPLATVDALAAELARRLVLIDADGREAKADELVLAGSARRRERSADDIDVVVITEAVATDVRLSGRGGATLEYTYADGAKHRGVIVGWAPVGARKKYFRVDLFFAAPAERPFALFHYTGSSSYNVRTRALAKRRGWRLNQYGIFDRVTDRRVRGSGAIRTEQDLARFLGVSYRDPSTRY